MLADEIRAKANDRMSAMETIKNEIVEGLKSYCQSEKMDKWIKKWLLTDEAIARGEFEITTSFWAYLFGCSPTNFSCGGYMWSNPEKPDGYDSRYYRGVELSYIQQDVCKALIKELTDYLIAQGFPAYKINTRFEKTARYGTYHTSVTL